MFETMKRAAGYAGNCSPKFICPLCLQRFDDRKSVTVEHVPARSLGGQKLLLTCKQCNNNAGSTLQGPQLQREKIEEFWTGTGTGSIGLEFKTDNGTIRGEVEATGTERSFQPHEDRISPDAAAQWLRGGFGNAQHVQLGKPFSWPKGRIADLRDAYLWIFARYGYSFVARPEFEWVRSAIREGVTPHQRWAIVLSDGFMRHQQERHGSPVILATTSPKDALIVARGPYGVLLPTPLCVDPYSNLRAEQADLSFLAHSEPVPTTLELKWDFGLAQRFALAQEGEAP